MAKGLLHSPFATTELFYITPGRIHLLRANGDPPVRTPPVAPCVNVYMNL